MGLNRDITKIEIDKLALLSGTNTGDEVSATTAVEGIAELATQTEVNTGTDATRIVTSDTLEDKTHGTFTGTTITDNVVLKVALQELETAVESAGGGINNVVEDLTPQLGGNLDVNGKEIVGANVSIDVTAGVQIELVT